MKKIVAYILFICALMMLYLGISMRILPPAITGLGFLAIAWVFYREA